MLTLCIKFHFFKFCNYFKLTLKKFFCKCFKAEPGAQQLRKGLGEVRLGPLPSSSSSITTENHERGKQRPSAIPQAGTAARQACARRVSTTGSGSHTPHPGPAPAPAAFPPIPPSRRSAAARPTPAPPLWSASPAHKPRASKPRPQAPPRPGHAPARPSPPPAPPLRSQRERPRAAVRARCLETHCLPHCAVAVRPPSERGNRANTSGAVEKTQRQFRRSRTRPRQVRDTSRKRLHATASRGAAPDAR